MEIGSPNQLIARQREIKLRRAIYRGDVKTLRKMHKPEIPESQTYLHDPIPEAISQSYADYLFSQPPKLVAESGQEQLDAWLTSTNLLNLLVDAHLIVSSEGAIYWRVITDPASNYTDVEWLTADRCYTTTDGLVIVSDAGKIGKDNLYELKHHNFDGVRTVITTLTAIVDNDEWKPMSAPATQTILSSKPIIGQVNNKRDLLGEKILPDNDYLQVLTLLLALDEATSIGGENVQLSAPDMFVISGELEEILNVSTVERFFQNTDTATRTGLKNRLKRLTFFKMRSNVMDESSTPPVKQIEKKFDASPIIAWRQELRSTIIKSVGLVQQATEDPANGAQSGLAIKLRYMPTENAAESRRRLWAQAIVQIVEAAAAVASIPAEDGGQGISWELRDVVVEFGNILPEDMGEIVRRESMAVAGEIRSRLQAIKNVNPNWTADMIEQEFNQIESENGIPTQTTEVI